MLPIPESIETAEELRRHDPDLDVLAYLQGVADQVQALVPDCIGMSVAWLGQGLAFTLVASDEEVAVLDSVQYLVGGPCVEVAERGHGLGATEEDLLNEDRWRLFARATAHRGVASTVTLPITERGDVVGSVNLYGASGRAFDGHHEDLAAILGEHVSAVVSNADLGFDSRRTAEQAPAVLRAQTTVSTAIGLLSSELGVDVEAAHRRLDDAAERAGITVERLAHALVTIRETPGTDLD